jgi:arginine transport system substrate-binding protein
MKFGMNSLMFKTLLVVATMMMCIFGRWLWHSEVPSNLFVVGTNSGFPPFELLDDQGNLVGFDIDLARQIADALGKKLELKDMSFDALIVALQQGKIDCAIAGISITSRRQQEIALIHYFGEPLKKFAARVLERNSCRNTQYS